MRATGNVSLRIIRFLVVIPLVAVHPACDEQPPAKAPSPESFVAVKTPENVNVYDGSTPPVGLSLNVTVQDSARITRVQGDHLGGLLYELDFSLPKSAWLDHEKKLFSDLVQSAAAEVLLVPCQVTQRAFDRVERLLVTLRVNQLLTDGGLKTIDPFLVARALGEGQRTIADDDVKEFAAAVGAKRVLRCYLGRDPRSQGKFHFVLACQEDQRFIKRTWDELEFNDVQLPNESIREVEAEVRAFLQVESSNPLRHLNAGARSAQGRVFRVFPSPVISRPPDRYSIGHCLDDPVRQIVQQ